METKEIILRTENYVRQILEDDHSGHDWWHILRVRNTAIELAVKEEANQFVVELAALLHDIADDKLIKDEEEGIKQIENWLTSLTVSIEDVNHIIKIIKNMSFKGGNNAPLQTIEGKIVQDSDRLDALGAIGIARTFAYAGSSGSLIYDPTIEVRESMTKEEYRNGKSTAINHFYEKLLKLSKLMNTESAKQMAEARHQFMEMYLDQFYKEWNGKK
ncbi:HD domain-containing protein [Cytobacillus suaedae]|nr:HD domain-containing protein [Cytobacillus suaedae]